jgi:dTDP-glucose 4,6-dehydratase
MNKKKVLITGTGGFIFGNFVRKAIHENHPYTFVSIDKITKSTVLNNIYSNANHKFYIGDIADPHFVDVIFEYERPNIVIHGAAESAVDASLKDPNVFIHSNILGTQVIINACLKWKVERLIYCSTDEIFGQLENENSLPWIETDPINPRNPYSASKAAGELLVKAAHHSHGLTYNITRSSNNYGPRQTNEKLIPRVIKCIMNNEKIPVYGQGLQIRDWMHVFDNCNAILCILKSGEPNSTYNISANQEYTNIEVVQRICNAMGGGHSLIEFVADRPGHDFRYSVSAGKIRGLGWKPGYKFSEGLIETVEWYRKNTWFIK